MKDNDKILDVMNNEEDAITWIKKAEDENHPLHFAWTVLKKYYDRCKKELKELDNLSFEEKGTGSKEDVYETVQSLLTNNELFLNDVLEFLGLTKEELDKIINSKEETTKKNDTYIKIYRFYNMRLKLGHSARITYLADLEFKSMLSGKDSEEYRLLNNTVLLSALLHDIGRFYQATRFNTFLDKRMDEEKEDYFKDIKVDHAVAGYYYAIAEALRLHMTTKDRPSVYQVEKFIEEVIAALVVRFHQEPNNKMPQFDYAGDIDELSDLNLDFKSSICRFILYINKISKDVIGMPVVFDEEHKKFIDKFLNEIFKSKNIDTDMSAGFKKDPDVVQLEEDTINGIEELLKNTKLSSLDTLSEKIIDLINKNLKIYQEKKNITDNSFELTEREKELFKSIIIDNLEDMLNYDIAVTISETIKNNPNEIDKLIKVFISKCYNITTDADKIDILNQRALGIYNTGNSMRTYEIFPQKDMSLKDILKKYFRLNVETSPLKLDNKLLEILNRLDKSVIDKLKETVFNGMDIFYKNSAGKTQFKDNIILDEELTKRFKYLLEEDYLKVLGDIKLIPKEIKDFKQFKKDNFSKLYIQISAKMLKENISYLSEEEQKELIKNLVLTPGMFERFKHEDIKGMQKGWECDTEDAKHVESSTVAGLLIQLNQFIFVNMRNLKSFMFIRDNQILERILNNYDKDSPEYYMIKDYIDYAVSFVNKVIEYCLTNNKTSISKQELANIRSGSNNTDNKIDENNKGQRK